MRKIIIFSSLIIAIFAIQFLTYKTIARNKLSQLVIQNLQINNKITSDTVLFSWIISVCGMQSEIITPYNLKLYSKKNFQLIKNKLSKFKVLDNTEYAKYCGKIAQEKFHLMNNNDWNKFVGGFYKDKAHLEITAIEERIFIITTETNWHQSNIDSYHKDKYLWILFRWIKI